MGEKGTPPGKEGRALDIDDPDPCSQGLVHLPPLNLVTHRIRIGTVGRSKLNVLEWASTSIAWGIVCSAWGVIVSLSVTDSVEVYKLLSTFQPSTKVKTVSCALDEEQDFTPDLFVGTVHSEQELDSVRSLVLKFVPRVVLIAVSQGYSRNQVRRLVASEFIKSTYAFHFRTLDHVRVGGATTACWKFITLTSRGLLWQGPYLRLGATCPQNINTIIDDTVGGFSRHYGRTEIRKATELGWDLSHDPLRRNYWVAAPSVFRREVIRTLRIHELLALWDFPQPKTVEYSEEDLGSLLSSLVAGPPGKMLRKVAFEPLKYLWDRATPSPDASVSPEAPDVGYKSVVRMEGEISARHRQAVKPDDAPIDFAMWALDCETEEMSRARDLVRLAAHSWWRRNLTREAIRWFKSNPFSEYAEREVNRLAIVDCLRRAANSTFWEWDDGSRLIFWRWREWWKPARDGEPFWHEEEPPKWMRRNTPAPSWEYELLLRAKENKLVARRYLECGYISCIVPRFGVSKGEFDIRLVWDAKRNGYNLTLWCPSFWLPTFATLSNLIIKWIPCSLQDYLNGDIPDTPSESDWRRCHQADMDVGEMFLNFMLHHSERHSFGVRLETEFNGTTMVEFKRFQRLLFGCKASPIQSARGHARALEIIHGDPSDPSNAFQWETIAENYPFTLGYNPSLPRIMKLRKDGDLASGSPTYVDDGRPVGSTNKNAKAAARQLCAGVNYLGEQDSSRKRRPVSLTPGAHTGKLLHTNHPHPVKAVLKDKWGLVRAGLIELKRLVDAGEKPERKFFRSLTGQGMSQTEIYTDLRPYYKSFYNALEVHRLDRDDDGWRIDESDLYVSTEEELHPPMSLPPATVDVTREMHRDLIALLSFYKSEDPEVLLLRPRNKDDVAYLGGDASAAGYGVGVQRHGVVRVMMANWRVEESDKGSNWREATCQARLFLGDIRAGRMDGLEVWTVSDNLVWTQIAKKGMSSKKGLSDIVREIKMECRSHEVFWHPIHVSGKRMIELGFDGLSRGDFDSGVMLGADIRHLVPIGYSAIHLAGPPLTEWLKFWMGRDYLGPLEPKGWFTVGHRPGKHLWAPPPGAALLVLEEIAQAKLKRPHELTHVFLCQRLLYHEEWRRRFEKEFDFWMIIESNPFWPNLCCEPLIVGISFPLRSKHPWKVRRLPQVVELGKSLQTMFSNGDLGGWNILREFWLDPWGFFRL